MTKITDRRTINKLVLLFTVTYMISYITRINYGAIISEIEKSTSMSKSMLSLSLTGSFITYGTGQIISGICGDRFSPKKLVLYGLCVTTIMNLIIPFCQNQYQMLVIWCINGFAQAFMYPPLVRLMTSLFSSDDYKKATVKVSWGSSVGTIIVYLISPLLIAVSCWESVFFFSALCGIIMIFIWNKYCIDIETKPTYKADCSVKNHTSLFTPLMLSIMLAIILQGMLRDSVTTWMPSYISETYSLNNIISILTCIIMPIFSIICCQIALPLYRNNFKNPLLCSGVIFGFGTVSALALFIFSGQNAIYSVVFSALLSGSTHGVNLILICMIPPFFSKYGNVSTVTGILNSCTYIGSAISAYGIAVISENFNWSITLLVWLALAAIGTFICFACIKPWNEKFSG